MGDSLSHLDDLLVRIPLKPRKHFSGLLCDCLNRNHNCDDHIFISYIPPPEESLFGRGTHFKVYVGR